jgi:transcription initiation factor TFIIIB Brf1 subunit/transcription initiation factor TFIIB
MKKLALIREIEKDFGVSIKKKVFRLIKRKKGFSNVEKVLAAAYLVLKQQGYPISYTELLKYAKDKEWKFHRRGVYTFLKKLSSQLKNVIIDPDLLIEKYAKKLNYTQQEIEEAKRIAKMLKGSGKNPKAIAVSALYIAGFKSGKDVQQTQLWRIFGITETTIRVYFRKWREIEKKELLKSITT